jgi:hypothetical protein
MTLRDRPPERNARRDDPGRSDLARPDHGPLLSERAIVILTASLVVGTAAGVLTYLAGSHVAAAGILAGLAAFGTAIPVLHQLVA